MALTLGEITTVVDTIAPFRLAYDWDNVGLQIGDPSQEIRRLLVALEVNEASIEYASERSCQAMLVHHPLIFRPQSSVRMDSSTGRLQMKLIRSGIGLIAAHTNLDRVLRGTNGALAEKIALREIRVLEPATVDELFKFTVFVPRDYTPKLIEAIHRGGGGRIGNYSHCTFRSPGVGTYVPEHGAHPFLGREGQFEQAEEDRLETLVSRRALRTVLHEVMQAHPYEEVAYDVFPLYDADPKFGLGVVGLLPTRLSLRGLAEQLCEACGAEFVTIAGDPSTQLRRVAIITGSAGSIARSVTTATADVLITGEMSYHHTMDALDRELPVITIGHSVSERIFADYFSRELKKETRIADAHLEIDVFDDFPEPARLVTADRQEKPKKYNGQRAKGKAPKSAEQNLRPSEET